MSTTAARRPATLLLAGGPDADRPALARTLGRAGFRVIEAASGAEALRALAEGPEVVLLDASLPDLDARALRRHMVAEAATRDAALLQLGGAPDPAADGRLALPCEPAELVGLVNLLLRLRDAGDATRDADGAEHYRLVFDRAPLPMWIVDEETHALLDANDVAVSHYGYEREELLALRASDLQAPSYLEEFHRVVREEAGLDAVAHLSRHRRKDGTELDVEIVAHALTYRGRPARLVIGKDVTAKRRAECRLRASAEQLRAQFMAIPVPAYSWHAVGDDFALVACNQAARALSAGRIGEWIGTAASRMFGHLPVPYLAMMRQCLRENRVIRLETSHPLVSTGERKDMVITFAPVQPDHVLLHAMDDTDRRAAERALRDREERYRALTENALELVCVLNADATIQYVSPTFVTVLGLRPHELLGTSALDLLHPDDLPVAEAAFARIAARPGALERLRLRLRDDRGGYRLIEYSAKNLFDHAAIRGIVCNGRDVTEHDAAQAELRFRAHLLDAVEQSVKAMTPDGRITYMNRYAERLYGVPAAEAVGRHLDEVMGIRRTPEQQREILRTIARGQSWSGELEVQTRAGRSFPAQITNSPIHDDAGRLVGMVGICQDISARRALEEQLRQSQKLEAIGKLAGGIAHDFNNLLTVIRASTEFVRESLDAEADAEAHADLAEVAMAVSRASALTQQLLAFSRRQVMSPQALDVNAVVADMRRMLERLIGEDISLETRLAPGLGTVHADRGQLEQVLMNLVVNARDAMPRGGALTIATSEAEVDESVRLQHADATPGRYLMLSVADTGHGMDRSTLAHIFEPFFTTKGAGRGTGLGLATVYGIVRQSGGHVWAYSEPGEGTVLKVYLPLQPACEAAVPAAVPTPPRGTERVLLVEDEDAVRAIARRLLQRLGYAVCEARNGREALDAFRACEGGVDLVLTDMVMPEMSGREVAEALRRERPGLPVLYMSGYTEDEIVRRGLDTATGFLEKPFTAEDLGAAVRGTIDRTTGHAAS